MAYCRLSDSDAYIYDDSFYGIMCCMCSLQPARKVLNGIFANGPYRISENFVAGYDHDKMIAHIAEHREAGDYIPEDVDERLIKERDCDHVFVEGPYGMFCEKCWRPKK